MIRPLQGLTKEFSEPSSEWPSRSTDDSRLASALDAYLEAIRSGKCPDRSAFLAEHADIAEELKACLAGLDFVQSAAQQFSPSDAKTTAFASGIPAVQLGEFRIVRELGRGGMGIVYEAVQTSLGRRVALKILPIAGALDPRQLRRFQIEAQAAAHLHHPRIVPIFAVGSDQGVHYYAMQFIDGSTFASMIDARRRASQMKPADQSTEGSTASWPDESHQISSDSEKPGCDDELKPSERTSERPSSSSLAARAYFLEIARLIEQAAGALEHAHELGVVHRDIKPANLLIDPRGEIWVTDFGLARFREDPGLTRSGDLLGTLRYMSPEQARGGGVGVDHRTDIYSLGATLYEAVTLRPAFNGRDRDELLRQVILDEPVSPRKFVPAIPRELETIILKAMAKEPSARYQTAQELADDLGRVRRDEPIRARRATLGQHAAKWMRRHRVAITAATGVLVVAMAVAAGMLWREQLHTAAALQKIEDLRRKERAALPRVIMDANSLTLTAMQKVSEWDSRAGKPGDLAFYRMALDYYGGIIELTRDDPDARMREMAAKAQFGLAMTRMILRLPGVEESYIESAGAYEALAREFPERSDLVVQRVDALEYLALYLGFIGGPSRAEPLRRQVLEIERGLVARNPGAANFRTALGTDLLAFAEVLASTTDRRSEAESYFLEAIDVSPNQASAYNNFAWFLASSADRLPHDPARALTLARRAVEIDPSKPEYWNTLGTALVRNSDWAGAASAFDQSMSLGKGGDPNDWLWVALIHARRGELEQARRRLNESVAWITEHNPRNKAELFRFQEEATRAIGEGEKAAASR